MEVRPNPHSQPRSPLPSSSESAVSVLLTSFAGLGLPRTLSLPTKACTSIHDVIFDVLGRLPTSIHHRINITTVSNKTLRLADRAPVSSLLSGPSDTFLSLRLSARLCGGKGGFGSQLRAAGGRMSSRKGRNQNQNPNGSNRNLDGRRLRTVDEAKRLAEYLAVKPEMEKKEKEDRRKRWEAVVDAAERREADIKAGKSGPAQGRLDADFVDSKELAEEKTREAVLKGMREGTLVERTGSESSSGGNGEASDNESGDDSTSSSDEAREHRPRSKDASRTFFGWDDEVDDDSDSDKADTEPPVEAETTYEGKGKAKAC